MPKRKNEDSLEYIVKKLKHLENKVKGKRRSRRRRRRRDSSSSSSSSRSSSSSSGTASPSSQDIRNNYDRALTEHGEPNVQRSNVPIPSTSQQPDTVEHNNVVTVHDEPDIPEPSPSTSQQGTSENNTTEVTLTDTQPSDQSGLNPELLEILGADPGAITQYGPDINNELANRLIYILRSGLKKEERVEFIKKYLVPENCQIIAAPELNTEIKAALSEAHLKRDKALELRQKSVATVISCLTHVITTQMMLQIPDHELLQKLVDATRLLCDVQYNDTASRKFFALSTVKKEIKDQLSDTKISKYLFGDNLSETLKAAKAVTKSSADLKDQPKKFFGPTAKNWKTTAGSRRPAPGPSSIRQQRPAPTTTERTYRQRQPAPPPPANSYNASSHRPRQTRKR